MSTPRFPTLPIRFMSKPPTCRKMTSLRSQALRCAAPGSARLSVNGLWRLLQASCGSTASAHSRCQNARRPSMRPGHVVINSVLGVRTTNVLIDPISRGGKLYWIGYTDAPKLAFVDSPASPVGFEPILADRA